MAIFCPALTGKTDASATEHPAICLCPRDGAAEGGPGRASMRSGVYVIPASCIRPEFPVL